MLYIEVVPLVGSTQSKNLMETHLSIDEQFLRKVHQVIEKNIDNESFSVEVLAHEVGLSRSMLYRKLMKLTGKSASEYITHIRLERAKQLLEHNSMSVSETAYQVGFKSPSYFNKVFKKHYHTSPGSLMKNHDGVTLHIGQKAVSQRTVALVLFLIVIGLATGLFFLSFNQSIPKSIAVLPIENLTGEEDNDYFVDGIHEALIGELGKISSLRVISRTSTLRYKNSELRMTDIANELGVGVIARGSVLSIGDSIQLIIHLVDADDMEQLISSQSYHEDLSNVLNIQSGVALDIADDVNVKLSRQEEALLESKKDVDPDTYKAYLRGMHHLHLGTPQSFDTGMDYLQQAIDHDPGDPFAYAGIALGYATLGHGQLSSEEAFNQATIAANKAIKLDPTIDEAYTALALINLYHEWNWSLAERTFTDAIANNPNNATAHAHFAWYHFLFSDLDVSIKHARQSVLIAPFSPAFASWLALLYFHANDFEQAEYWGRKALDINQDNGYGNLVLGWISLENKQYSQAIEYHKRLPDGIYWKAHLGYCYVECGYWDEAVKLWKDTEQLAQSQSVNPCFLAMMAANLGYKELAFEYLNRAIEEKVYPITYINFSPCYKSLRVEPQYDALLKKMNLPTYTKFISASRR